MTLDQEYAKQLARHDQMQANVEEAFVRFAKDLNKEEFAFLFEKLSRLEDEAGSADWTLEKLVQVFGFISLRRVICERWEEVVG